MMHPLAIEDLLREAVRRSPRRAKRQATELLGCITPGPRDGRRRPRPRYLTAGDGHGGVASHSPECWVLGRKYGGAP